MTNIKDHVLIDTINEIVEESEETPTPLPFGEINTASNYGTVGEGLYDSKEGIDLRFKNLEAGFGIALTPDEIKHIVKIDIEKTQIVMASTSRSLTVDDSHKIFVSIPGGDDPVIFTMDEMGTSLVKFLFFSGGKPFQVVASGGEIIYLQTGSAPPTAIQTDENFSFIKLLSSGSGTFVVVSASGKFYKVGTPTQHRIFDGNVPGAVTDHFVSFDSADNIKDSGNRAADFEPAFDKRPAFNRTFGAESLEVCEGNDGRLSDYRTLRYYSQDVEPAIESNGIAVMWKDTNDVNRIYLVFRRGEGDQVKVELT